MQHLAAQDRVGLGVDLLRIDDALDEPRGRAVGEALELRRRERLLRGERRDDRAAPQRGRAVEGTTRAIEAARPVVGGGEGIRTVFVVGREPDERAQALALARRRLERPGQSRERPAPRGALNVGGVEERPDVLPERARLARHTLVARRLANEHEPPGRPRAGRVEEVAVARDGVRSLETSTELARAARRRGAARGARDAERRPSSSPSTNTTSNVRVLRSFVVEHGDPTLRRALGRDARALERREDVVAHDRRLAAGERSELAERALRGSVRARVDPRVVARRRRLETPCVAHHAARGEHARPRPDRRCPAARRERAPVRRAGARPPPRPAPARRRRVRAGAPRRSRPSAAPARRTASGGTRRGRHGCRRATRTAGPRGARRRAAMSPRRRGCSTANGTPSCANAASSGARQRSTDSQTTATRSGAVPPRRSAATSLARSSTVPRVPAPSRKRMRSVERRARRERRRRTARARDGREPAAASGWTRAAAPRSRPRASAARSSTVRSSAANAARPGSYGIDTRHVRSRGERLERAPTRRRSDPRSRTRRRALRSRRRGRPAAVRRHPDACRRDRGGPSGPAPRDTRRRARRARRSARSSSTSPASSSPIAWSSVSANPDVAAERRRPSSSRPPTARRTASARWVSVATGSASSAPSAMRRNRSSNVPIVPASSAGRRRIRSRSTRSTSTRFGTTSHGSRSSTSR